MRRPADEEFFPAWRVLVLGEREPGYKQTIQKALENRRHRAPPSRKDEHHVLRPSHEPHCLAKAWLGRLITWRDLDDIRIELHLSNVEAPDLGPRLPGPRTISICQSPAKTAFARVRQYDQNLKSVCTLSGSARVNALADRLAHDLSITYFAWQRVLTVRASDIFLALL